MSRHALNPQVEVEEKITTFIPPNNGSGPLWCYGSPTIVRDGDEVYVSVPETDPLLNRLCKTRWQVWRRRDNTWSLWRQGRFYDEREPCPLVRLPEARLSLSANPLIDPDSTKNADRCAPQIVDFSMRARNTSPSVSMPVWDRTYESFCEHSYRGIGVDYERGETLLLNIDGHNGYAWALRDRDGLWPHQGFLRFPIRACYPQVGLQSGAAHVLAVGDIVETNETWRVYKKEKTGNAWDYDFRRLFYVWTPDIRNVPFSGAIELASHEATAGHIRNADMWLDADGAAHLLYTTKNIWHDFMRDRFFPDTPIVSALEYRVIKEGVVIRSHTLITHVKQEGDIRETGILFSGAAFHALPDGKLRVVYADHTDALYIMQVYPWVGASPSEIPLRTPIHYFFIPTPRNGSETSDCIDLYGMVRGSDGLYYARLRA